MNPEKEKDHILSELQAGKDIAMIENAARYIPQLEADGYVRVAYNEGHTPEAASINEKGRQFLEKGGYSNLYNADKARLSKRRAKDVGKWISGIIATVVAAWIIYLLFGKA